MDFDVFCEKLSWYLKHAMVVFSREPAVERTINFVTNFAVSLTKAGESEKNGDRQMGNKLLQFLFEFALKVGCIFVEGEVVIVLCWFSSAVGSLRSLGFFSSCF